MIWVQKMFLLHYQKATQNDRHGTLSEIMKVYGKGQKSTVSLERSLCNDFARPRAIAV